MRFIRSSNMANKMIGTLALLSALVLAGCQTQAVDQSAQTTEGSLTLAGKDFGPLGTSLPSYSLCPDEITPGFSWSGAPANTKAFALTMHAPIRTEEEVAASIAAGEFQRDFKYWWILYNIPGSASSVEVGGTAGGKLGSNIAKGEPGPGYSPPCPRGEGTGIPIAFTMYALSEELEFAASTTVTWEALQEAMEGKVLESLTLDATFDSMAKSETE